MEIIEGLEPVRRGPYCGAMAWIGPDGRMGSSILIRTFVADGVRWIVDYKTGSHAGGDASGFLDRERERHRAQLERYAAFVRALDARPIRVALYFPLVADGWREWAYDG